MPISSGGMGYGPRSKPATYRKPKKGTKTVSAMKPGKKRK